MLKDQVDYGSFARNVHSQCGEDGIIEAILAKITEGDRWCVEFGAWDGLHLSNTRALIDAGAHGVLIEGDPEKVKTLEAGLAGDNDRVIAICAMVGWDGPETLDQILSRTPAPIDFDLLSIDIDGNDYHVWRAVQTYRPKLVVIEFNPTIPNGVEFVQPADPSVRKSSSITSMTKLAQDKGYELAAATDYNAFFVRGDLFPALGVSDNSLERLRTDTTWQTQAFFGFDGHLHLVGGRGLAWHGTQIPHEVRLVPRIFDGFPGDFSAPRYFLFRVWRRLRQRRAAS